MIKHRGHSLMEVLAALALMAVLAPVTIRAVTLALQMTSKAKHSTEAVELAEMKLNEILADQSWRDGDLEETFDEPHNSYRWRLTVEDYSPDSRMRLVTVQVLWGTNDRGGSISVSGLADAETEYQ